MPRLESCFRCHAGVVVPDTGTYQAYVLCLECRYIKGPVEPTTGAQSGSDIQSTVRVTPDDMTATSQ